jgi:hypothetical protein
VCVCVHKHVSASVCMQKHVRAADSVRTTESFQGKKTDRKNDIQADKPSERLPHRSIHLQTWPGVNPNWKASIV